MISNFARDLFYWSLGIACLGVVILGYKEQSKLKKLKEKHIEKKKQGLINYEINNI